MQFIKLTLGRVHVEGQTLTLLGLVLAFFTESDRLQGLDGVVHDVHASVHVVCELLGRENGAEVVRVVFKLAFKVELVCESDVVEGLNVVLFEHLFVAR